MDAGLLCVSYVGIPPSPGAFPRFSISTPCSTTASNDGGSRSSGLRVDNGGPSFICFPERLAPYSYHLSNTSSGSVKVILCQLYHRYVDRLHRKSRQRQRLSRDHPTPPRPRIHSSLKITMLSPD